MKKLFIIYIVLLLGISVSAQVDEKTIRGEVTVETSIGDANIAKLLYRIRVLEGDDVTSPGIDSAYIETGNDSTIIAVFDEQLMTESTDSVMYAFSFTYGVESGDTGTIDSAKVAADRAYIHCGENIPTTDTVYLSYEDPVTGGIHDVAGNPLRDFTNKLVFNGTAVSEYVPVSWWKCNGNFLDAVGANNGTEVNNVPFSGDTAWYFSDADGNDAVNVGSIALEAEHAWSFWLTMVEDAIENYYLVANMGGAAEDGFNCFVNGGGAGTYSITYQAGNGAGGTFAYSNTANLEDGVRHNIIINVNSIGNGDSAWVKMYNNGVLMNAVDSVLAGYSGDFALSGQDIIIGANDPGNENVGFREGALIDNAVLFDHQLTSDERDSIVANEGNRLWTEGATSVPEAYYDVTWTEYERINFGDAGHLGELTQADLEGLYIGDFIWDSNPGWLVSYGGDTVNRVYHQPVVEYGGGQYAMDMPGDYNEGWYFFNVLLGPDFPSNWSNTGKIPGVGVRSYDGTYPPTGCATSPGCSYWYTYPKACHIINTESGSSIRGSIVSEDKDFGWYIYWPDMPLEVCTETFASYGVDFAGGFADEWTLGEWHNVGMRVVLNTVTVEGVGDPNGILEFYKDGVCGAVYDDFIFRNYSSMNIDVYLHSIFFGGQDDPSRIEGCYTYWDDFVWGMPEPGSELKTGPVTNPIGTTFTPPNYTDK